jgi:hypothetical protein
MDSINFRNKRNKIYLKNNPQYALTNSLLVFIKDDNKVIENKSSKNALSTLLIVELQKLKKRGRTINLYYNSQLIKVYEIVNEPKNSKISDLIF